MILCLIIQVKSYHWNILISASDPRLYNVTSWFVLTTEGGPLIVTGDNFGADPSVITVKVGK
jgi:hypothetical protein